MHCINGFRTKKLLIIHNMISSYDGKVLLVLHMLLKESGGCLVCGGFSGGGGGGRSCFGLFKFCW